MPLPISLISASVLGPLTAGYIATSLFGYRKVIPTIPGILFHSVLPSPSFNMSHYSTNKFRTFLHKLSEKKFKTLTLSETATSVQNATNRCLITFDDGMECIYHHALPLMEEYAVKSTIFCIAGFTAKTSSWDIFHGQNHLSVEQIRRIAQYGHEIGSHTFSHANLIFLNDKDLENELKDSKKVLEDIVGKEIKSLSFPYGSWNKRIWEKAQESGYSSATLYRNHNTDLPGLFPVYGAYRFDKPENIILRLNNQKLSLSIALAKIMSHFSKGTPIVKFRKNYIFRD